MWHDRRHLFFVGVGECKTEDSFVCFGVKTTQRACVQDFLRDRKKTKECKVPKQSTEEDSKQKLGEGDGQRRAAAKREAMTCKFRSRVGQRERMSQRFWWLCRGFARIHARYSLQMHGIRQKSAQTSLFLRLELTQVRACLFFFSSTLLVGYVVSCMFGNQCEMSLTGDERNH